MNFRNNKGFTGIDISVAVIVILIFIPTVFGIVYNMQKTRVKTERQAEAVDIATNILEVVQTISYSGISTDNNSLLITKLNGKGYTNPSSPVSEDGFSNITYSHIGKNDVHFRVKVGVKKIVSEEDASLENPPDLLKQVKVMVEYPIGNSTKSIDISTLIQNKNI